MGLEMEEEDDERGVSWRCGGASPSDSPRSLSRSPMHRSGPPIPFIFLLGGLSFPFRVPAN